MDCLPFAPGLTLFGSLTSYLPIDGLLAQASSASNSAASSGISAAQYMALAAIAAVIVIPFLLSGAIAKSLRMPNYSTRIGLILFAVIASVTVLVLGEIGLGVDLRGGTILVYEIDPSKGVQAGDDDGQPRTNIGSSQLIPSLIKRINPSGTQEIVIRPYGESQIEIIIPAVDQREVDRIKEIISKAGILRFAILANSRDHGRLIELARGQAEQASQRQRLSKTVFDVDGETPIGFWALVDREEAENRDGIKPLRVDVSRSILRNPVTGRLIELPPQVFGTDGVAVWMRSEGLENIQVLMAVDTQLDVTGEDLAFASTGIDNRGAPCVRFKLTDFGSGRFLALTTNNAPDGQHFRQLGIVLDDALLSAPNINQPIQGDGIITGSFTTAEVEQLVRILQAGQLPAALTKLPIAENQIDATLGADTIRKGFAAIGSSLLLVLLFILVYYRFIGIIACLALVLNLLMTLAVMILISQPLTLPGLAGLVLTVGMSVDANVLIFERIREELNKGSAPRMAIRNGFSRATTTIVDANLTTLITAIVLYAIGTDQIRGFAVTLILGILFSMFTAIYMSRTLFDIAERKGFLSLSMSDLVNRLRLSLGGGQGFDFMGKGRMALAISALFMIGGIAAIFARGAGLFDIDFAGGSSVTFRVAEPTTTDLVRGVVAKSLAGADDGVRIDYTVNNVSMDGTPAGTVYKVDTSIKDVDTLKGLIGRGFEADGSMRLVTYDVEIQPADQRTSWFPTESLRFSEPMRLVAFQGDAAAVEEPSDVVAPQDVPATTDDAPATSEDSPATPQDTPPTTDDTPATTDDTPPTTDDVPATTEDSPAGGTPETTAADADSADANLSRPEVTSRARLKLGLEGAASDGARISGKTLISSIQKAAEKADVSIDPLGIELDPVGDGADQWSPDSELKFSEWIVSLPMEFGPADEIMRQLQTALGSDPIWISSSSVGGRVAGDMINRALGALFTSLLCIVAYIWFRFQRVIYGLAAVAALLHDVVITLGAIAVSYWVAGALGFLLIDPFKISLTVVAALLTVIGYSLNDTIVVFDRIRETKGKSLRLTSEVVNTSINSTLSRTLLTSLTTLLVVGLLYIFGGEGIHAFAFSLVVGVIVGTYSSIFIASPILLWLMERYQPAAR